VHTKKKGKRERRRRGKEEKVKKGNREKGGKKEKSSGENETGAGVGEGERAAENGGSAESRVNLLIGR